LTLSLNNSSKGGLDGSDEKLRVIDIARAPTRSRTFPDDIGIALERDQRFAYVRPILKLRDRYMVAGLTTGTSGEKSARSAATRLT